MRRGSRGGGPEGLGQLPPARRGRDHRARVAHALQPAPPQKVCEQLDRERPGEMIAALRPVEARIHHAVARLGDAPAVKTERGQARAAVPAARLAPTCGNATLTTVTSSCTTANPKLAAAMIQAGAAPVWVSTGKPARATAGGCAGFC